MKRFTPLSVFIVIAIFICIAMVTTGFAAPYPDSDFIIDATFSGTIDCNEAGPPVGYPYDGSDGWPITWGENEEDDDVQFTAYGDGDGFDEDYLTRRCLGVAEVYGNAAACRTDTKDCGDDIGYISDNNDDPCLKADDLIQINDILYMWIGHGSNSAPGERASLWKSTNYGANWADTGLEMEWRNQRFCHLTFLQFDKNYTNTLDDYVYIYGTNCAYNTTNGAVDDGSDHGVYLMRVDISAGEEALEDKENYEFYAGPVGGVVNNGDTPTWGDHKAEATFVFYDSTNPAHHAYASYNQGLKRVILSPEMSTYPTWVGGVGVYESVNPWGPWRTVYYNASHNGGINTFQYKFPTKWHSSDGLTMQMLYSGVASEDMDAFCLQEVVLDIGDPHYVDCSCANNGDGTGPGCGSGAGYAWNTIESVNDHSMSAGDDVYFKENTTCSGTKLDDHLEIDWAGTSSDAVMVGCYDGENDFDCDSSKPILNGSGTYPTGGENYGLITITAGMDYITIQDLELTDSEEHGIAHDGNDSYSDGDIFQRLTIHKTELNAILLEDCDTCTITENTIYDIQRQNLTGSCSSQGGSAIQLVQGTRDTTVSKNIIYDVYGEGIGIFRNTTTTANPNIVEYNRVYNCRSQGIHSTDSHTIVRYNLVGNYDTDDDGVEGTWYHPSASYPDCTQPATRIGMECSSEWGAFDNKYQVYGNLVFGVGLVGVDMAGIYSSCTNSDDTLETYVYNNTVVNSGKNYSFNYTRSDDGKTREVKNNISVFYEGFGGDHGDASTGFYDFDYNCYSSTPDDDDMKGSNDPTYPCSPSLAKTSDWRHPVNHTTITGEEFIPQPQSDAIATGTDLGTYNSLDPYNIDFTATPIDVEVRDQDTHNPWDIGAFAMSQTYYVDCGDGGSLDYGTYDEPFNSIADINAYTSGTGFYTGDDLYFKEDAECETSGINELHITWSGTPDDNVVVGCYDGEADFVCDSSGGYGIIDGDTDEDGMTNMTPYYRLIKNCDTNGVDWVECGSYQTYQDLKIQYGYAGMYLFGETGETGRQWQGDGPDGWITVKDCWFYRNWAMAWGIAGNVWNVTFTNILDQESVYINIDAGYPVTGPNMGWAPCEYEGYPHRCCTGPLTGPLCGAGNSSCTIVQDIGQWEDNKFYEGVPTNITWEKSTTVDCGREWSNIYHPDGMKLQKNKFYGSWTLNAGLNLCSKHEGLGDLVVQDNLFEGSAIISSGYKSGVAAINLGDGNINYNECFETEEELDESEWGQLLVDYSEMTDIVIRRNLFAGFSGPYDDDKIGFAIAYDAFEPCTLGTDPTNGPQEYKNIVIENNTSIDNDVFSEFTNYYYGTVVDNKYWVRNNIIWMTGDCTDCIEYQCNNSGNQGACYEFADDVVYDNNLYSRSPKYRTSNTGSQLDATWAKDSDDPGYPSYSSQSLTLSKMTGWRSMTKGQLDGTEFQLIAGQAVDEGLSLSRNEKITYANFKADPISVDVSTNTPFGLGPDIGAYEFALDKAPTVTTPASSTNVATDTNLIITRNNQENQTDYGLDAATHKICSGGGADCASCSDTGLCSACAKKESTPLTCDPSGSLATATTYTYCSTTFIDLDGDSVVDDGEAGAWKSFSFTTATEGGPVGGAGALYIFQGGPGQIEMAPTPP